MTLLHRSRIVLSLYAATAALGLAMAMGCAGIQGGASATTTPQAPRAGAAGGGTAGTLLPVAPLPLSPDERPSHPLRAAEPGEAFGELTESTVLLISSESRRPQGDAPMGTLGALVTGGKVMRFTRPTDSLPAASVLLLGHGAAARWMEEHLTPGTRVEITEDRATATPTFEGLASRLDRELLTATRELDELAGAGRLPADRRRQATMQIERARAERSLAGAAHARGQAAEVFRLMGQALARATVARLMGATSRSEEARAVWMRLREGRSSDIERQIEQAARAGFNMVFVEVIYDGRAIFPSRIQLQPQHEAFRGHDPLEALLIAARRHGVQVHAWVHVLHIGRTGDSPIMQAHPGWLAVGRDGEIPARTERGAVFLSPASTEVRAHLSAVVRELTQLYGLDGVHLDSIRLPTGDAATRGYDYSNHARQQFHASHGHDPMMLNPQGTPEVWEQWLQFREDQVTEVVQMLSEEIRRVKPELVISARVPTDLNAARRMQGQNFVLWAEARLLDLLVPQLLRRDAAEVRAGLERYRLDIPVDIPFYAGLAPFLRLPAVELARQIDVARQTGAGGVALLSWADLTPLDLQALEYGAFHRRATVPPLAPAAPR